MISVLSALVSFDTTSRNSNLELISWIEAFLDRHDIACERVYDLQKGKANLWVTVGPTDRAGYVLSGHTDVVPVDGQSWSSDPFRLTQRGTRLYGRGTTDMKGFLAACLSRVSAMSQRKLARPIHFAFSYDEEVGCVGVRDLVAQLEASSMKPLGCFVGEPTSMDVVVGHKAKRNFRVTARGRSCHSSLAPLGVNAVAYLAEFVAQLHARGSLLVAHGARDGAYDVPFTTLHVGTFQGGTALNIVPERAVAVCEVRAIAADDPDAIIADLRDFIATHIDPRMKAVDRQAGMDIDVFASIPGLDTAADAPITTLAKSLAGRNAHGKVAYGTEAGLFHQAGIPTVVIGPGNIAQAHQPDEYIDIDQLQACGAFIDRLIDACAA
jgi:acetylornithine deacetylase